MKNFGLNMKNLHNLLLSRFKALSFFLVLTFEVPKYEKLALTNIFQRD